MSKRRFKLFSGFDMEITLEIDTDLISEQMAHDIVYFWHDANVVVAECEDEDLIEAVARYTASSLVHYLLGGYNERGALEKLAEEEGWYENIGKAVVIVDYLLPAFAPEDFEVEEL